MIAPVRDAVRAAVDRQNRSLVEEVQTMSPMRKSRATAAAVAVAAVAAATAAAGVTAASASDPQPTAACGVLFDDFAYTAHDDPAFAANGWSVRDYQGGPGVPGARWEADNLTFPRVDGEPVAQLAASTDGTPEGTTQTEFSQREQRFFEGTYASRIHFSDAPVTGVDGDLVNQTFYTISPLRYDNDPIYSELDFSEYLPNGGWGTTDATNFFTSYNTYQNNPEWAAKNKSDSRPGSMAGWHVVSATVADGHIRYYVDGELVADHDRSGEFDVYPRQDMSLNFNQWFIDLASHTGGTSTYEQQVDWVYYAENEVVTAGVAAERAAELRASGVTHRDDVGSC